MIKPLSTLAHNDSVKFTARFPIPRFRFSLSLSLFFFYSVVYFYFILENVPLSFSTDSYGTFRDTDKHNECVYISELVLHFSTRLLLLALSLSVCFQSFSICLSLLKRFRILFLAQCNVVLLPILEYNLCWHRCFKRFLHKRCYTAIWCKH